jgi:protein TonB
MKTPTRTKALSMIVLASMCGCSAVQPVTSSIQQIAARVMHPQAKPATTPPPSPALDAYKTQVAHQVVRQNPGQTFSGPLPEMLPAVVVLNITVDRDGHLTDVAVQRSRDPNASKVALASMQRSGDLPKPDSLLANNSDALTFSETFLFNAQYRFQLRSLARPQ